MSKKERKTAATRAAKRFAISAPRGLKLALEMLERMIEPEDDLPAVLDRVLSEVVRTTRADRGFIVLREVDRGLVVHAALDERGEKIRRDEKDVSRALATRATEENRAIRVTHAGQDPRFATSESIKRLGVRSAIAAPLRSDDERFGAVVVDRRVSTLPPFDQLSESIVGRFARLASRLILRARRTDIERGRALALAEEVAGLSPSAAIPAAATNAIRGSSPPILALLREIARLRASHARVLITGESGAGKELVARAVHETSPRARKPFVAVNCGAISDSILEDELFGHERGAFTGADRPRPGLFVEADGGTLFLDEIAEASPRLQRALLRVLETGEVRTLGGENPKPVDVRVIAATHRDLASLAAAGRFRHDLLYRIDVARLRVPPLRERREDIATLAREFATEAARGDRAKTRLLDDAAIEKLEQHAWPGNVRELRNSVQRLLTTGVLQLDGHQDGAAPPARRGPVRDDVLPLAETERRAIILALESSDGNLADTARKLAISRRGLYYLLDRHGLRDWRSKIGKS
jgi:transcriptional regulator with GAF, ATPase, and Fis domain